MVFTDKQGEAAGALLDALTGVDYVRRLESALSMSTGKRVVALSSADAALNTALYLCGVGRGDYVFVPTYTFFSYIATVDNMGAVPVFLDCDPATRCVSPAALETALLWAELQNKPPRAVVIDNAFGAVADYDVLLPLCKAHGVHAVELACDAFYGEYNGARCGTNADYGVWAFDKRLFGGGGALVTSDDPDPARRFSRYDYSDGENHDYRLNNFVAALDYAQLDSAKRLSAKCKANLAALYSSTDCIARAEKGDAAAYALCRAASIAPELKAAGYDVKKPPAVHTISRYSGAKFFEHEPHFSAYKKFDEFCLIGMDISSVARVRLSVLLNAYNGDN